MSETVLEYRLVPTRFKSGAAAVMRNRELQEMKRQPSVDGSSRKRDRSEYAQIDRVMAADAKRMRRMKRNAKMKKPS